MYIATITFETFCFQYLAGCLMFKLIILAQEAVTEWTFKYPSAVIPNTSLTFLTNSIHQRTGAGVAGKATSSMAYPGFAVITYGSLKHSVCDINIDKWLEGLLYNATETQIYLPPFPILWWTPRDDAPRSLPSSACIWSCRSARIWAIAVDSGRSNRRHGSFASYCTCRTPVWRG